MALCLLLYSTGPAAPVYATQYNPPWLQLLWAHFPNPPDPNTLDTHGTMNAAQAGFDLGYSGYKTWNSSPVDADAALALAESDAIWWFATHGFPGGLWLYKTAQSDIWMDSETANESGFNCNSHAGRDNCLSQHSWAQMHDIRLMVFQGCNTGLPNLVGDRLHTYVTSVLGVDSALGFSHEIGFSAVTSDTWAQYFASWLAADSSVSNAAWQAAQAVFDRSGGYNGYNYYVTSGGGIHIEPPGYGS